MTSMTDGRPSASIMIKQRPGSNAREVIQNIKTKWQKSRKAVLRLAWITISPMTYHAFLTPPYNQC